MIKSYILINLGAPSNFSESSAKSFLREFLGDKTVLPVSSLIRYPLSFYIAKKRAMEYAANISKISVNGMHPLRLYSENLARKIAAISSVPTYATYRYGNPKIGDILKTARSRGSYEFRFIPMYPQCAMSTSISARRETKKSIARGDDFKFLNSYFDNPAYISALAKSAREIFAQCDCAIASFHSLPKKSAAETQYVKECETTVEMLRAACGYPRIKLSWQSKMGRGNWLEPSTEETAVNLARAGFKRLAVICPGFSCDCTETLIEIARDLRNTFIAAGGEKLTLVPCLNDSDTHVEMFAKLFESLK